MRSTVTDLASNNPTNYDEWLNAIARHINIKENHVLENLIVHTLFRMTGQVHTDGGCLISNKHYRLQYPDHGLRGKYNNELGPVSNLAISDRLLCLA